MPSVQPKGRVHTRICPQCNQRDACTREYALSATNGTLDDKGGDTKPYNPKALGFTQMTASSAEKAQLFRPALPRTVLCRLALSRTVLRCLALFRTVLYCNLTSTRRYTVARHRASAAGGG
eukprot:1194052-Prorocentrum_minimum.AAC.1